MRGPEHWLAGNSRVLMIEADACFGNGSPNNPNNVMVVSTSNSSIVLVAAGAAATKNDGAKAMEPQSQTRGQVQMIMHERRMLLWNQNMKDDQFGESQAEGEACCRKSWSSSPWWLSLEVTRDCLASYAK